MALESNRDTAKPGSRVSAMDTREALHRKKRRGVGAAWIAVPVLCVAAVVILLLSGVLGGTSAPLPETKPAPVETPEPGNEEKPAGELSAIREQAEKNHSGLSLPASGAAAG